MKKGIRLQSVNRWLIAATCIAYACLMVLTTDIFKSYQSLQESLNDYISCQQSVSELQKGSDYLTERVRQLATGLDAEQISLYMEEAFHTKTREKALEEVKSMKLGENLVAEMEHALQQSYQLMDTEYRSMALVCLAENIDMSQYEEDLMNYLMPEDFSLSDDEKEELALKLVYSEDYINQKTMIQQHLDNLNNRLITESFEYVDNSNRTLSSTLERQQFMLIVIFLINILVFLMILFLVLRPLQNHQKSLQKNSKMRLGSVIEFKDIAKSYNDFLDSTSTNELNLKHIANHDQLTGVYNRTAFDAIVSSFSETDLQMALIIVDIDDFKHINDQFGHAEGDVALQQVAKLLQLSIRYDDTLIRFGGDEFVIIMKNLDIRRSSIIARKMEAINEQLSQTHELLNLSVSSGAAFSANGYSQELFDLADKMLYKAKKQGKRCCVISDKVL